MKKYLITESSLKSKDYNIEELDWYEGYCKNGYGANTIATFDNANEAKKEFNQFYNEDNYNIDYIVHYSLEWIDEDEDTYDCIEESSPSIEFLVEKIYDDIKEKLIKKRFITYDKEELIDLIEYNFYRTTDLSTIIDRLVDEIKDKINLDEDEIEDEILYQLQYDIDDILNEKKCSIDDIMYFASRNSLEDFECEYKDIIDEMIDIKNKIFNLNYSCISGSDKHIVLKFRFLNYDEVKNLKEKDFYCNSKIELLEDITIE